MAKDEYFPEQWKELASFEKVSSMAKEKFLSNMTKTHMFIRESLLKGKSKVKGCKNSRISNMMVSL